MWTLLRIIGLMSLVGVVAAAVGLVVVTVVAFQYGINRENGLGVGLIAIGVLIGILKRRDVIWLLRYGLTGDRRRGAE